MRNIIFIFFFIISGCSEIYSKPFSKTGELSESISELLKITGITGNNAAEDIVARTQAQWFRKPGIERWHIDKTDHLYHEELKSWLKENNFIDEIKPKNKEYKYLVILGASARRVIDRIQYAEALIRSGMSFEKIIILCGERPLDPKQEPFESYAFEDDKNDTNHVPLTETDMMKYVMDRSFLSAHSIEWHSSPMIETKDNKKRRPTTADTIALWMQSKPSPGSCLIISTQPYVQYQEAVARAYVPTEFSLELAAPECSRKISDGNHLDNLARWMYQEWELMKKN